MRQADLAGLLDIIQRDFEQVILPDVRSERTRFVGSLMAKLLDIVRSQLATPSLHDTEKAVASEVARTLLGDRTATLSALESYARQATSASPQRQPDAFWQDLIRLTDAVDSAAMGGLVASPDDSFKESGSGSRGADGATGAAQRPITAEELTAYLRRHRPGLSAATATEVTQLASGFSKDTFLVTVDIGGTPQKWVLRRDVPLSSLGSSVVHEYPLLAALHGIGLPVPQPLWVEADGSLLGGPVLATGRLPGSADIAAWSGDPVRAKRIAEQTAILLARLHQVDPGLLPPSTANVAGTVGTTPGEQAAHLYAYWQDKRSEPSPGMEAAFGWLLTHAPAQFSRRTIVHTDYGFHNLLVEGDRITGLLDWEFTHIGDPLMDLAWVRPFVEPVMPWADFTACYRAAGGVPSDPDAERFFAVLNSLRIAVGCSVYVQAVRQRNPLIDSKQAYIGWCYARRFVVEAIKLIQGSTA